MVPSRCSDAEGLSSPGLRAQSTIQNLGFGVQVLSSPKLAWNPINLSFKGAAVSMAPFVVSLGRLAEFSDHHFKVEGLQ